MIQHILNNIYLYIYYISRFLNFNAHIIFSFKIIIFLIFLIIMRVGVPRFRYDHLSKIGWLKFSILLLYIFIWIIILLLLW